MRYFSSKFLVHLDTAFYIATVGRRFSAEKFWSAARFNQERGGERTMGHFYRNFEKLGCGPTPDLSFRLFLQCHAIVLQYSTDPFLLRSKPHPAIVAKYRTL